MTALRVLFIEDSAEDVEILALELEAAGYPLAVRRRVWTPEDLRAALAEGGWDLAIGDYSMPAFNGLEALAEVRSRDVDLPFFMISGTVGEELAVEAMRAGANDFLVKSNLRRLGPAVARELRERESRAERRKAEGALRESEEQLRQAQRMESVGRLAGGIAHDFNNILSVVSGYANLLQMKLARAGTAHRELGEIDKAVIKATALVQQLLVFSRRQVVLRQWLDLGQVVRESLSMLAVMLGEDVVVETRIEPALGFVHGDRNQLEQVIMNLAVNARDAMPKGGTLTLSLAPCRLEASHFRKDEKPAPGEYVRLDIEDNGIGMDEAVLSRIFEPFFTTKGQGAGPEGRTGTGLGLSTVYGIVRQAGGTIRVKSIPFAGTTFTVYFPAHQAPEGGGDGAGEAGPRKAARGESILLVEDDVDLRRLTKDLLVMEGYRVLEARDPEEALGFAQSRELALDLLLTDIVMPRQNGRDLAEAALALRPGLRVVFMSGYAPEAMTPAGGWPEALFLDKPFTPPKLLAKVRAALDAPRAEKHL